MSKTKIEIIIKIYNLDSLDSYNTANITKRSIKEGKWKHWDKILIVDRQHFFVYSGMEYFNRHDNSINREYPTLFLSGIFTTNHFNPHDSIR